MSIKLGSFLPRSDSKLIFVIVIACYSWAATSLAQSVVHALTRPQSLTSGLGTPDTSSQWAMRFGEVFILAPLIESLIVVGILELFRMLRLPPFIQVISVAVIMGLVHGFPSPPRAFIVAPGFGIDAAAYLYWRGGFRKILTAYLVIVSAHALSNLFPFMSEVAYAIRHSRPVL
jgi:hypothetical protein